MSNNISDRAADKMSTFCDYQEKLRASNKRVSEAKRELIAALSEGEELTYSALQVDDVFSRAFVRGLTESLGKIRGELKFFGERIRGF